MLSCHLSLCVYQVNRALLTCEHAPCDGCGSHLNRVLGSLTGWGGFCGTQVIEKTCNMAKIFSVSNKKTVFIYTVVPQIMSEPRTISPFLFNRPRIIISLNLGMIIFWKVAIESLTGKSTFWRWQFDSQVTINKGTGL